MLSEKEFLNEAIIFFNQFFGFKEHPITEEDTLFFNKYGLLLDCLLYKNAPNFLYQSPFDFFRNVYKTFNNDNVDEYWQTLRVMKEAGYKTLLDYGGGIGGVSLWLLDYGIEVTFAETNKFFLSWVGYLKNKYNLPLKIIDLSTDKIIEKYDVIILRCVLEHLPPEQQRELLSNLGNHLNGKFIITPLYLEGADELRPMHYHFDVNKL